jgi:hypothetical protein
VGFAWPIIVLVSAILAIASGLAWARDPRRHARNVLARAEEKPLAAVVEGDRVRVFGVARRDRGSLTASFSGRPCIAFRAVVEEYQHDGWTEVLRVEHSLPFFLVADGVAARVDGSFFLGVEIDHRREDELTQEMIDTLARHGVSATDSWDRPRQLRSIEAAIEDGDSIWVLGRARVSIDRRGQSEALRGPPVLRVFEGTTRDPVILADQLGMGLPSGTSARG